jgi:diguanylate cyclase (GGDEF)-like protein
MSYHWSIHQLTEYLTGVSRPQDSSAAIQVALERATEALEAELGVVVIGDEITGKVGFGRHRVPAAFLTASDDDLLPVPGLGDAHIVSGNLDTAGRTGTSHARLVIGRMDEGYTAEEQQMLQGMALVLGLVLHNLATLEAERQRHRLVETLLRIQRAISARRPLPEVLDAITAGASALLGGCPVALLLTDAQATGVPRPASHCDFPELDRATLDAVRRVLNPAAAVPRPRTSPDQAMLAERVMVGDEAAGCLVARPRDEQVQGRDPGELLTAFAQQVNLALTDAKTLDAVREAHHDSITALPNRGLFLERLDQQRLAAAAQGYDLTVLFIDLDRFKAVNDALGHQAGDELLAEVAQRILASIRPDDTAARLGGDEFAVLLHRAGADRGSAVAGRIIDALTRTFVISGREVLIGASVGIAAMTGGHDSASALLSDADVAMYCAKRSGRGRSVVFEPYMHEDVANRLSLRTDLQNARANGELWLAYQPILAIETLTVDGVEALMRWTHPVRGSVPPGDFIPIAEESDAILALGAWAIEAGVSQAARWRLDSPSLQLSLNVSARQVIDPALPRVLEATLGRHDVPAEAVVLEITESVLMNDADLARARLRALKDLGVRLAIDDFGTGYSSLSYLRQFPVDQVKVDRSFVARLTAGADDDIAVVRTILELCRSLRLQTVAEGIEEPEQLRILGELGCDLGQGYYFAHPMPPESRPDQLDRTASSRRG